MTIIIIAITAIVSIICFSNYNLREKLQLNPYKVYHNKEYWRLLTHAFVHADWLHLIVNMFVLFSFGQGIENYFQTLRSADIISQHPYVYYVIMYFSAIVIASLTTIKKYKDNFAYNAVGASGAVATVLFACIFFDPWQKLLFWAIIPVPGIIFGALYLWYSHYMSRRSNDNINHDAHFLGALYGFTFPVLLDPRLFYVFIKQLIEFNFR
jgi:membrane associated rhomboid family serine protease